jgi:rare lipoprotein A
MGDDDPRAVSYDENGRYRSQAQSGASDGPDEARDIISGRGLH